MTSSARLSPIDEAALKDETLQALAPYRDRDGKIFTIWATLAHHEDALRRFLVFSNHVLGKNSLPLRSRELMILRIAVRTQAAYEWDQHVRIARRAGLTDDEILAAGTGRWAELPDLDQLLLEVTDSILDRQGVDDDLYRQLESVLSPQQLIDVIYTVGQYLTIATIINTLAIQVDGDAALDLPERPGLPT